MHRRSLGALAIVIILLMAIVATAGLDNLPRNLRKSVEAASSHLSGDRAQFNANSDFIRRGLSDEPALFRTKAGPYREHLAKDNACLASAASELSRIQELAKANRRQDAQKVESELSTFDSLRKRCAQDAGDLRAEAQRWLDYKRQLPARLASMKANYEAVKAFDVDAAAAPAKKAGIDWPAKRDDIENRLTQIKWLKSQAGQAWDSSAKLRRDADGGRVEDLDYAALFADADKIDDAAKQLKSETDSLNQLAAQLYTSWDKLLLEVDDNRGLREKVRLVKTNYKDATLSNGQASSEERWEDTAAARKRDAEKQVGMVIARKAAGRYDSEVERVAQPPAIAYVAPPGQSNSYGSWQSGVWTWLPQYLILRELLNAGRGPIGYTDYYGWDSARRRGDVYYGRDGFRWWHSDRSTGGAGGVLGRARDWANSRSPGSVSSTPGGGFYHERPKSYGGGGGFSGSQYQSRGSYSGSRYQSKGGYGSFGSRSYSAPRSFGGGSRGFGGRGGRR